VNKSKRTFQDYIILMLKGFCMGMADVVPGVSGGTMAFILGIYEELINSIKSVVDVKIFKALSKFNIKAVFDIVPWQFLVAVFGGVLIAIFSIAPSIEWILDHHPILLWSFFFGLVLSSVWTISKRVSVWNKNTVGALIIGAIVGYLVVGLVPTQTPEALWFVFLSGMIAICAMVLPGISGSFLLVVLGKYQFILSQVSGVRELDPNAFAILGAFGVGTVIGIVSFAQVVSWFFKRYHDTTVAMLIGLMLGSLRKIWPWKETIEWMTDRHGELVPQIQNNILPILSNPEDQVWFALGLAIIGFVIVFVLDMLATDKPESPKEH